MRPIDIIEGEFRTIYSYDGDGFKLKSENIQSGVLSETKYYLGGQYEYIQAGNGRTKEIFYIDGDPYAASAIYIKEENDNDFEINYLCRDYLGSITHILYADGRLKEELSYDAWGRLRNPETQAVYAYDQTPKLRIGRGYTGHEHLLSYGLINMNARLYDPVLGRFLSPDPYVQAPYFSQNFNRYSYCLNNPLKYNDESGELFFVIVGIAAGVGAVINVATHWKEIKATGGWNGFWKGTGYFLTGAVAGGAGAAAGIAATVGIGGMLTVSATGLAASSTEFAAGATAGAASGATSGFILNTSNALLAGEKIGGAFQSGISGALTGGIMGGIGGGLIGGCRAVMSGRDFWTGGLNNRSLVQRAATAAENSIGGKGAVAGTKKHKYASDLLERYQDIHKDRELYFNRSKFDEVTNRKHILDVLDSKNNKIYDWKFGYPNKTPLQLNTTPQMQNYRRIWGFPSEIIKP